MNCFSGDMTTIPKWWAEWKTFMFNTPLSLPNGKTLLPAKMLVKIKHAKYPAITVQEEAISIPLSMLAQAVFDAILVHIVTAVSPSGKWQALQQQMCEALNRKKDDRIVDVLLRTYSDADVIFLQETGAHFW